MNRNRALTFVDRQWLFLRCSESYREPTHIVSIFCYECVNFSSLGREPMIPPDDSNDDPQAEQQFTNSLRTFHPAQNAEQHRVDCTQRTAEGDNVVDFPELGCSRRDALILMAKFWQPGRVKTRLAAEIGFDAAAALHELFTRRLTESLETVAAQRQLRTSPDDCCEAMARAIPRDWQIVEQGDGDLGQRMWRGFGQCFSAGFGRVVMIGADLPTLRPADIAVAFEHLATSDVVLGPAIDGGYYLIGLNGRDEIDRFLPLFGTLPWGTAAVLSNTLTIAKSCGLAVKQLEPQEDVDHWPDLMRLVQRLERSDSSDDTSFASQIRSTLDRYSYPARFSPSHEP